MCEFAWDRGVYEGARDGDQQKINKCWGLYGAWEFGLQGACRGNQMEIALDMIRSGGKDFNHGLGEACLGGHDRMILFMMDCGANQVPDCYKHKLPVKLIPFLLENNLLQTVSFSF